MQFNNSSSKFSRNAVSTFMVEELSHASDQQTTQQTLLNPEAGGIMFF
jgi:hypothetical protein